MAAIFDFQHTQTSDSISTSLSVLLDPENMGIALEFRCYHVYELRYTLFPIYFRLMAAIFDFQHTQTSDSIPASLSVLPYPENMGIAVGISLLSYVSAGMCYWILKAAILDFWLPLAYSLLTIVSVTQEECPYPKMEG
jgi:hypothetical protein